MEISRKLSSIFGDKAYHQNFSSLPEARNGWIPISTVCRMFMSDLFRGMDDSRMCANVARALEMQPSTFVELDLRQRGSIRRAPFNLRVVRAIEFWFSDANFSRDLYLQSLVDEETQLVPLRALLDFKSLRQLLDVELGPRAAAEERINTVSAALTSSDEIDVVHAPTIGVGVRRRRLERRVLEAVERILGKELHCDRSASYKSQGARAPAQRSRFLGLRPFLHHKYAPEAFLLRKLLQSAQRRRRLGSGRRRRKRANGAAGGCRRWRRTTAAGSL